MNLNTAFQMVLANPPPASTTAITIDVLAWDKAQAMLAQMSPTNSDKIRKVGLALHNHYEGSAEVKDAYLCWVKTGDAYSEGEACALWDKADVNDPNAITIGTFIELAELDGIHQLSPAQERFAALTKCPLVSFIAFPEMTRGPPPSPVKKSQVNIEAFLDAFGRAGLANPDRMISGVSA